MITMDKSERRTQKKLQDCFSFKGEDFDVHGWSQSSVGRYAKRFTSRTRRRMDRAIERNAQRADSAT